MDDFLCAKELQDLLRTNLNNFKRNSLSDKNFKKAAVAITVVDYLGKGNVFGLGGEPQNGAAVILTRRSGRLNSHSGQWALPGGRVDEGETVLQAALRELSEEVGLVLHSSNVLGLLDDFVTRSGFHITPVVFWAGPTHSLHANEDEVASIHRIPCRELCRDDAPVLEKGIEMERPILYLPVGNTFIATPTAAILYQFREVVLNGKSVRVAHYDQPSFAWK